MRVAFIFLFLILSIPVLSHAQEDSSVLISEVAWMGSPIQDIDTAQWWRYEWIELYNTSSRPVSLEGWSLEFSRESVDMTIELTGTIPAHEYFLVVSSERISSAYGVNYQSLAGRMVNGGQLISLKDGSGGIRESIDFRSGWPAGENEAKHTMERVSFQEQGSDEENWTDSVAPGGSPGSQNTGAVRLQDLRENAQDNSSSIVRERERIGSQEQRFVFILISALIIAFGAALIGYKLFFAEKK